MSEPNPTTSKEVPAEAIKAATRAVADLRLDCDDPSNYAVAYDAVHAALPAITKPLEEEIKGLREANGYLERSRADRIERLKSATLKLQALLGEEAEEKLREKIKDRVQPYWCGEWGDGDTDQMVDLFRELVQEIAGDQLPPRCERCAGEEEAAIEFREARNRFRAALEEIRSKATKPWEKHAHWQRAQWAADIADRALAHDTWRVPVPGCTCPDCNGTGSPKCEQGSLATAFQELREDNKAVARIAQAINTATVSDAPAHPRALAAIDAVFAYFVANPKCERGEEEAGKKLVAELRRCAEHWERERAKTKQAEKDDRASGKLAEGHTYEATWNYYALPSSSSPAAPVEEEGSEDKPTPSQLIEAAVNQCRRIETDARDRSKEGLPNGIAQAQGELNVAQIIAELLEEPSAQHPHHEPVGEQHGLRETLAKAARVAAKQEGFARLEDGRDLCRKCNLSLIRENRHEAEREDTR